MPSNTPLEANLRELLAQWRETATLYESHPSMREAASGYRECIGELEGMLNGDLSMIETWEQPRSGEAQ